MSSQLDRLIESLPRELEPDTPESAMTALLQSLGSRPVPTGRLLRLWSLGSLQARIAAGYLGYWIKSFFTSEEKKALLQNEAQLKAAVRLLRGMGYLKGAVMKVGQTLASYPNVVPKQFVDALGSLHFQAPPMHFSLLREQVHNELGAEPEEVFAEFETEAFAAASLGQVHRARLTSGERVAVKIQYPNIARTIADDMKNMKAIITPMRLTADWDNLITQIDDICQTLETETDYERELEYAELARTALADDDEVVVPRMYRDLSSRRVLTMEMIDGKHLGGFLAGNPGQEARNHFARKIFSVSARLFYSQRMVHADPHPGNFLFTPDGKLGLIDFGCCRVFTDDEWDYILAGLRDYVRSGTISDEVIVRGCCLTEEEAREEERLAAIRATIEWLWEPIAQEGEFAVDEDYMSRGIETLEKCIRGRYTRGLPINIWTNRMFYGSRALLYQLGAKADFRSIHEAEIARAGIDES